MILPEPEGGETKENCEEAIRRVRTLRGYEAIEGVDQPTYVLDVIPAER